jgi:uncharacterized membrane protein YfcA
MALDLTAFEGPVGPSMESVLGLGCFTGFLGTYYAIYFYILKQVLTGGLMGVGGGAVIVPFLSLFSDLDYKMVLATSLAGFGGLPTMWR